ncbi:unnamed protein product [Rhizophagus irregularis]|nr:unnamed protein product [Rhizophagus irregularis]
MRSKYYSNYDRVQVPENEVIIQNHPLSCYTSRKFDYSTKLNEILKSSESSESLEHWVRCKDKVTILEYFHVIIIRFEIPFRI